MYFGELEEEGHGSPSWMGSYFDHYKCPSLFRLLEPADENMTTTYAPPSFGCRSLLMGSQKSRVDRRPFNALGSS